MRRAKIHVKRNWVVPPGFRTEMLTTHLMVTLDAGGNVVGTPEIVERSGNPWYDDGVLRSIPVCRAPWIGIIPADGQVDAEDVARLFEAVKYTSPPHLGKVRRRFRMDGPLRKVVSVLYNGFVWMLWPSA